jgi:hypothetical protein
VAPSQRGLPARSAQDAQDESRRGAGCEFGGETGAEKAGKGRRTRFALLGAPRSTQQKARFCRPFDNGETRTRTWDTTIFSRVLYQLSYLAVVGPRC